MSFDIHQALNHINVPADWVGLREVRETTTMRHVRDGKPEGNGRYTTHGVMVEVLVDGQLAYCGTQCLNPEGLRGAAKVAYEQAKAAAPWTAYVFTSEVRPPAKGRYRSPRQKGITALSAGDINHLLKKACDTLKVSDKVISTRAAARITETEFRYVSSNGSDVEQEFLLTASDYSATAQEGSVTQNRTDNGMFSHCYQMGLEFLDEAKILQRAQVIGEQAVELLSAEECPSETTDLVLAPDQMMLQIHESVGHPLELDRILGDERNYAGWSFVRLEDFGSLQYGSPLMNISFDPTLPGEYAAYAFDDGGLPATKEYLIQSGKLLRGLGGKESQIRSKVPGVANFRSASWNRAPIDRMANLNLEPGDSSFEEIIGSVENGIYMESNRSWSIDDYRNKFQFGCEYAKRIEDGKLTTTLRNPNYRGVSTPFWNSLKMVGNADTREIFGTPYCGKGEPNQVIRVGHASPVCLFENVEVFGGAA